MTDRLLTVAEVAKELNCEPRYVYEALRAKKLVGSNMGGRMWRIYESDLRTFVKAHRNVAEVKR